ncbi:hypothetical protein EHS25_007178 [Saitozyma podzolica]|jgi:hypothetical protein|uniref:Uncharacterized protein n=1 Tax=Saitozyma podzolica TaxID=1890683 RepID=A0A427XPE3_9TREE|nr:hypothetical protein EHS25_007178 [Saitozyma podzolica]
MREVGAWCNLVPSEDHRPSSLMSPSSNPQADLGQVARARRKEYVRNLIRLHPTIDDKRPTDKVYTIPAQTTITPIPNTRTPFLGIRRYSMVNATRRGSLEGTPPQSTEDATRRGSLEGTPPQSTKDATRRDSYCSYCYNDTSTRHVIVSHGCSRHF